MNQSQKNTLSEVAKVFLKLGCTAFGGPAVHIAMMEKEVVTNRKWMTKEHFLDLVGATNLIPGPNSTEMTMHCGREQAGFKGLIVAGMCFILPAVLITGIIAWSYERYGTLPDVQRFVYGIKPAIIAVIIFLMIDLGKKALKSIALGIIAFAAGVLVFLGFSEIAVLFGAGLAGILWFLLTQKGKLLRSVTPLLVLSVGSLSNIKLFWIFLKVGSILYGSGYVLFAFLDDLLVTPGLLSKQQLVDAIAVGQFTPGPVFSSATFIGWQIGGIQGAILATVGIFLPSFVFVSLLNPLIPILRKSQVMSAFLDAVNVTSVAVILSVVFEIGKESLLDWRSIVIAIASFAATFFFKNINTAFIILGGSILGYLLTFV
jgi:chromate transporter